MKSLPVLVVEDDPDVRRLVARSLEQEGFTVIEASDGADCRRLAPGAAAVVLDRVLPDADGLDLLAELRASPETAHIPVVVLTGRNSKEELARARKAGANAVIPKPFDPLRFGLQVRAVLVKPARCP